MYLLVLCAVPVTAVAIDLGHALMTGRARGRFGTIIGRCQPERFRRYVYSSVALLVVFGGVLVWLRIAPQPV